MDDSVHLRNLEFRRKEHQRNTKLDVLLAELAALLAPLEKQLVAGFSHPRMPVLFLVGNPRSGSTVFMQFLQSTGAFAVPTNVLSRFYYAPCIGAKIQQLLFNPEYDFRGELAAGPGTAAHDSSLGKTRGPLAASEMLHFWRRFLPHYDPQYIDPSQYARIDTAGLAAELAALESVFGKPLALKGGMLQSSLPHLLQCAKPALLIYLRREPFFILQSLLMARENHYGRRDLWWSLKPKEYEHLKNLDPLHQVAGQVFFTAQAVSAGLQAVPETQRLILDYESFCRDPAAAHAQIAAKCRGLGCEIEAAYRGPATFPCRNETRLSAEDAADLRAAYEDFASGRLRFPA